MLIICLDVRMEKYFPRSQKQPTAASRGTFFETEGKYFSIQTDQNGKYRIYFFTKGSVRSIIVVLLHNYNRPNAPFGKDSATATKKSKPRSIYLLKSLQFIVIII